MLNVMQEYQANATGVNMIVGGPRMARKQYQDVLLDSMFTIVPRGLHPETFRLYESLETG